MSDSDPASLEPEPWERPPRSDADERVVVLDDEDIPVLDDDAGPLAPDDEVTADEAAARVDEDAGP